MQVLDELKLAARNLGRSARRTAAALLTVAGGVTAFLLAGGFIAWVFEDMRDVTIRSNLGHLQIVRPGFFEKGIADPYRFLLPAGDSERQAAGLASGIVAMSPRLMFSGLVSHGETTLTFAGEGCDPAAERLISNRIEILAGDNLPEDDSAAALLGEGLAKNLGVKPGDTIVVMTTTPAGSPNAIELKVAGIFMTITKDYDDYALRLPIAQARKVMRVGGATSWVMLLDDWRQTDAVKAALARQLPAAEYEVVPWHALSDFYNKTVELFGKQVGVMKAIIGIIIVLTIMNTLTMSVLERTTEIGTSLAIGLRPAAMTRLFLFEGVLIGLLGGLLGLVVGYLLALAISAIGIPMPPAPGMAHGFTGHIIVTPALALDAIVLAIVTTLLASVVPAWRAGRLNVVDALRYNQ
jgi:putative ABC transport system permease protein